MLLARNRLTQVAALAPGAAAGPPLDGITTGLTGAWSASRQLLTSYGGAFYSLTSGKVDTWNDQSGSARNFTQSNSSNRPPISAVGSNSRDALDFDGTNHSMSAAAISNFIANNAGYIVASFIADNPTASNIASIYENTPVFADNSAFMGTFIKNGNLQSYNWDGTADTPTAQAISAGTAYVVEWRHDAGTFYQRLNGSTEVSTASGNTTTLTGLLFLATSYLNLRTDIKIFEMATYSTVPSSGNRDAIATSFKTWCGA